MSEWNDASEWRADRTDGHRCRRHPNFSAKTHCDSCGNPYCDECLVTLDLRTEQVLCVDCALKRAGITSGRRGSFAR